MPLASFVSAGAQRQGVPGLGVQGLAWSHTKQNSHSVEAFTSPKGCLTGPYSVFPVTQPESPGVIPMGLEAFTGPCGCERMRRCHGISATQRNCL